VSNRPVVEFKSIAKSFQSQKVLEGFGLSIAEGEFLTLLGPSGCGKTTLLRLLAGFESPDAGDILIDGQRVNDLPPNRRSVNTVFQSYALFPHLSVFDNVAFGLRMGKVPKVEIGELVLSALESVRMAGFGGRMPRQLSGGQQQRVALARALVNRPRVLLLDEPLSALDYKLRRAMQVELKALQRQLGITFVFVTHDQEEALSLSDRVVVMRAGAIEQQGGPREIYEQPANRFVAEFVGESNLLEGVVSGRVDSASAFVVVEGVACVLRCPPTFRPGDRFWLLLRPEDLRLVEESSAESRLQGRVIEAIYKGMLLETVVRLDGGQRVLASGFFDPSNPDLKLKPGQTVGLAWTGGRERVLPVDEANLQVIRTGLPQNSA